MAKHRKNGNGDDDTQSMYLPKEMLEDMEITEPPKRPEPQTENRGSFDPREDIW